MINGSVNDGAACESDVMEDYYLVFDGGGLNSMVLEGIFDGC